MNPELKSRILEAAKKDKLCIQILGEMLRKELGEPDAFRSWNSVILAYVLIRSPRGILDFFRQGMEAKILEENEPELVTENSKQKEEEIHQLGWFVCSIVSNLPGNINSKQMKWWTDNPRELKRFLEGFLKSDS